MCGRTMSFVLPKNLSAESAPIPRNPNIRVDDVDDGELLAVREFPGELSDLSEDLPPAYDAGGTQTVSGISCGDIFGTICISPSLR